MNYNSFYFSRHEKKRLPRKLKKKLKNMTFLQQFARATINNYKSTFEFMRVGTNETKAETKIKLRTRFNEIRTLIKDK